MAQLITAADRLLKLFLGLLLLAMVLLNLVNAGGRYLLGQAVPGADEILMFSMVWLVFLGALLASAKQRHLGFNLPEHWLPEGAHRLLAVFRHLFIALVTGYVALQSWAVLEKLAKIGQKSMALQLPMTIPHSALLVCFGLTAPLSLYLALRVFQRGRREAP
jgi:TRAP-type C4-dicarboxylate transport system permease small subunit